MVGVAVGGAVVGVAVGGAVVGVAVGGAGTKEKFAVPLLGPTFIICDSLPDVTIHPTGRPEVIERV